jgi:hypothetical protein
MAFRILALSLLLGFGCVTTEDLVDKGDDGTLPLPYGACKLTMQACYAACDLFIDCERNFESGAAD